MLFVALQKIDTMAKEFKRSGNKDSKGKKPFRRKEGGPDKKKTYSAKSEENKRSSDDEIKPRKSSAKHDKPVFERFRDDSRPSEFGSGKSRRSSSGSGETKGRSGKPAFKKEGGWDKDRSEKPAFKKEGDWDRERSAKPAFKKEGGWDKERSSKPAFKKEGGRDKDNKAPFGAKGKGRPFDKKSFSDKPNFKSKAKAANPYDLDESDYEHSTVAEEFRAPKKSSSGKKRSSSEKEPDGLIRLNKYIANAGICSRREADQLIATGVVQVNGKTVTEMGYKVKPTDIIKYGGQTLRKERMVYLILNKPKDYITTVDDPQERRTVLELIHGACKERVYPVGRLDRATTGLLMFTNDGDLTKKMTHPRYGVRKIYHVELDKPLKRADMDKITEGIELEDGLIKVDEITYVGDGADKTQIGVELHSGKNRIVRRIFEHAGYNVRKLDRVMFGPLTKKDLARGRWRFLTDAEVGMLKMISAE